MYVKRVELETFEYNEFVSKYVDKLSEYYRTEFLDIMKKIIEDSPKDFFDGVEKAGLLNSSFTNLIKEEYGELWISDKGFIDLDAVYAQMRTILKNNGYESTTAKKAMQYMFINIVRCNKTYHQPLISLYNKCICKNPEDKLSVSPIPKEYRDLSNYFKGYMDETCSTYEESEKLLELFDAAEALLNDDLSLDIVKSIKDIVIKKPERTIDDTSDESII